MVGKTAFEGILKASKEIVFFDRLGHDFSKCQDDMNIAYRRGGSSQDSQI